MMDQRQHRQGRVVASNAAIESSLMQAMTRSLLQKGFDDPCINAFVAQPTKTKGKQS
jgi:hypothetical protein